MKKPEIKYLKDHKAPAYWVDTIDLEIDIYEEYTNVKSIMEIRRNSESTEKSPHLTLDGTAQDQVAVKLNSTSLSTDAYTIGKEILTIPDVPDSFTLEITSVIKPHENTSLEGLYKASSTFLTQCEAEGFRKITYFPDRPDVMAMFTCRISADRDTFPVLLSNGNLVDSGTLENNRHFATWEDPFRKPAYLFALVAGDLLCIEDTFTTASGREVALKFYVEKEDGDKCDHAIESLKKSMKWDEEVFGLEYDLDIYMIVSTHSFNAGAMENKGLNIFNSKYVLARPETATDTDFQNVEGVIGHEYFHNWTGNRVTLNSWFQLSLKEGLTVFRDQEFSSDMGSRAIKRISDVRGLRASQFPEDSGPMAHPVRPESYIEMNNFYTATVYNKGAEVIRMIHTLIGPELFRKGMDLYISRFDGKAVTTEDFVQAMEDAGNIDLTQFRYWYSQAGTPVVSVTRNYDEEAREYTLTFNQQIPDTPGQTNKHPMHIPVKMGLVDKEGKDIPLSLMDEKTDNPGKHERVLSLTKSNESFTFTHVPSEPVPSLFRGFSSPVKINIDYTDEERMFLMANDSDPFNRWDAAQQLFSRTILNLVKDVQEGKKLILTDDLIMAFKKTLTDPSLDKALISQALTLPGELELSDKMESIDVDAIHTAREFTLTTIARSLEADFRTILGENREIGEYTITQDDIARRKLKNLALFYLSRSGEDGKAETDLVFNEFAGAGNMTDELAALSILSDMDSEKTKTAFDMFYSKWKHDPLVLDKWFSVQATSKRPGTFERVKALTHHPDFSIKNPNKVRSLVGAFCQGNPWNFHQADGSGYTFLADIVIELDGINPSIAARMVSLFNKWKKYDNGRKELMKKELERIKGVKDLSKAVYEIVSKALV